MSQYYTVRESSATSTSSGGGLEATSIHDHEQDQEQETTTVVVSQHEDIKPTSVLSGNSNVVTTVVVASPHQQEGQILTTQHGHPQLGNGATTIEMMPADTLQLMGMANALPTSNLYVNYPHTMWEKDADGNRIPVQVVKTENVIAGTSGMPNAGDLLSQAAATIKQEQTANTVITTMASTGEPGEAILVNAAQQQQVAQIVTVPRAQPPKQPADGQPRPHLCEVCNKSFVKREHLTKHLRIHKSDNKRYSCEYCQKAFRDRYELVRHTRRHTGDFPFRCQECNKGFMRHERYMTHLRWHSGERPYQCTMCEKSFRDRSELNRHSRRHTGDLPYKCETCGKGFLRRERYVTHVRIHTGEKPFVCAVCTRGYRDKRELKKHQASHNHQGQSAPIPPNAQPLPQNALTTVQTTQALAPATITSAAVAQPAQMQMEPKTIVVQQTISLPNQPVPKELLGMNGGGIVAPQPLNPATIPLPASVASALQVINDKTAAKQAKAQAQQQKQQMVTALNQSPQTITIAKQEPQTAQVVAIPQSNAGGAANNSGPLFYYIMPGNVPYNLASEGGAAVRVTTEGGNVATAQLVSVPVSAIQGVQTQGTAPAVSASTVTSNGGFPASWIIESTSPTGGASLGGRTNQM